MALSLPTPVGHLLDASTLALWRLDETASAAAADATGSFNLTAGGSPPAASGRINGARATTVNVGFSVALSTSNVFTDATFAGVFTAEAWFWVDPSVTYPPTWPGPGNNHGTLFAIVNGAAQGTAFMFGLGATGFFAYNNTQGFNEVGSWSTIPQGTWHHLAVRSTLSDATHTLIEIFVDGVKLAQNTVLKYAAAGAGTPQLVIGGESTAFNCFTGRIDDVRFSKIARTDAEIFDSYRRGALGLGPSTVSPISKVTDHAARAAAALIEQYKDKPRVVGLLTAFVNQVQDAEDGLWPAVSERNLQCASGAELDLLGSVVGEPRLGRADVSYRTFIQAKILLNLSSGTIEELYAVFALLLSVNGIAATMEIAEFYPKAFAMRLHGALPSAAMASDLFAVLKSAKDAGARGFLEYSLSTPGNTFTLDSGPGLDVGHLADVLPLG